MRTTTTTTYSTRGMISSYASALCWAALAGCGGEPYDASEAVDATEEAAIPSATPPALCGTWALQQIANAGELGPLGASIGVALETPMVKGFSLRVPWKSIDAGLDALEAGRALASQHGKAYAIRFMAGRHTPQHVFAEGAYYYVSSAGEKIPKPFSNTGVAGNPAFENAYGEMVAELAAYARSHGIRELHVPWYGKLWAEIDNGDEIRAAQGYSYGAWLAGHKKLIDIALSHAGPDLAIEFALSGHWGPNTGASVELANHMVSLVGEYSPKVFVQGNGLGMYNGSPTSRPLLRGMQMYGAGDYDWSVVFDHLEVANASYVEIYTPSFAKNLPHAAELTTEIAKFSASCPGGDTTAPTTPSNLRSPWKTAWSVQLAWNASTDATGVAQYRVFRNGVLVGSVAGNVLAFKDTGLSSATSYTYRIRAADAAGNVSPSSSALTVKTN